jgi:hypothetical protein
VGDKVRKRALTALVRAAIQYNQTHLKKNIRKKAPAKARKTKKG